MNGKFFCFSSVHYLPFAFPLELSNLAANSHFVIIIHAFASSWQPVSCYFRPSFSLLLSDSVLRSKWLYVVLHLISATSFICTPNSTFLYFYIFLVLILFWGAHRMCTEKIGDCRKLIICLAIGSSIHGRFYAIGWGLLVAVEIDAPF